MIPLALFLAACADMGGINPRARLLDANQLAGGEAISAAARADTPWPREQWWQAYGDARLDDLVARATDGNPTLRVAAARIDEAMSHAGMARSALSPQVNASASSTRNEYTEQQFIPPPEAGNWAWDNNTLLSVGYEVDLWGKNHKTLEAALDNVKATMAQAQEARLALETVVVSTYVGLAQQYELRDITEQTFKYQQDIVGIARRRRAAGVGTQLELTQAQAPLPATRARLKQIDESIDSLRLQLAALTGQGPGAADTIKPPALQPLAIMSLPSRIPAELVGRRPDVVAQRWRVEAAAKGIEVAKTAFYPNINLAAFIGFESLGFDTFLKSTSRQAGAGAAISLPIFDGGRLRSQLGERTATYDAAVETYNHTVIEALHDVAEEISSAHSLQLQREDTRAAVALAQKTYDLALRGFKAGLTDYLNTLQARIALLTQQQNDARLHARQLATYAKLMQALGGGVTLSGTDTSAGPGNPAPAHKGATS